MDNYTPHQARYFAEQITLKRSESSVDGLASAMSGVKVDLNPHQVDAALFAIKSPLSNGALLADEVGLGKTIEAGLVLAQYWSERKRRILLIVPASLRMQWRAELSEKFYIESVDYSPHFPEIFRLNRLIDVIKVRHFVYVPLNSTSGRSFHKLFFCGG